MLLYIYVNIERNAKTVKKILFILTSLIISPFIYYHIKYPVFGVQVSVLCLLLLSGFTVYKRVVLIETRNLISLINQPTLANWIDPPVR